jgi:phosphatidylinositol alpha-mannosyltransferase
MKIGLVCPYDMNRDGGVQEVLKDLRRELRGRGHDVWVITPRLKGYTRDPAPHMLFLGRSKPFHSPTGTSLETSSASNTEIDELLASEKFDVLNFHEPWIPKIGSQILRRSKAVNVATFHATIPDNIAGQVTRRLAKPVALPTLKYIDAFTAVSSSAAQFVGSLTKEPINIIPNPLNASHFKPPAKFDDDRAHKTVLYIGRLEGRKGVKYLLHAFSALQARHPKTSLRICSNGPDRAKLEALARRLNLKNVHFMGFISDADKVRYLRESDLFCSPALFGESQGIVLLEAMSAGLVTVAGDNPGYATTMTGLGDVSLVDPKHTREFARRLELLLYEPELRRLWRVWAKAEMPKYAPDRVAGQYLEVYEQALKRRHKQ